MLQARPLRLRMESGLSGNVIKVGSKPGARPLRRQPVSASSGRPDIDAKPSMEEEPKTSAKDMVKEAFDKLNSDTMTTESLLGETAFALLQKQLGPEKLKQITDVLDPILKNRRAITVASAVIDVALILAGIKIFQNVTGN